MGGINTCSLCHEKQQEIKDEGRPSCISLQLADEAIPCILESQGDEKTFRRNWARLIQKIYEVDPLVCPNCQGTMRVIGIIEAPSVIRAILEHLAQIHEDKNILM